MSHDPNAWMAALAISGRDPYRSSRSVLLQNPAVPVTPSLKNAGRRVSQVSSPTHLILVWGVPTFWGTKHSGHWYTIAMTTCMGEPTPPARRTEELFGETGTGLGIGDTLPSLLMRSNIQ